MRHDDKAEVGLAVTGELTPVEANPVEANTVDDLWDASEAAASRAAKRCEFQLTYDRAVDRREFGAGVLYGPLIPDAYRSGEQAAGDWESPADGDAILTEDDWIDRYASYAVQEAVHEALEWLRVDGRPWLDPHGRAENDIYRLVGRLVDELATVRAAKNAASTTLRGNFDA